MTAWLVYEIGRRVLGPRWGFVAAAIATLNPYLVWHDMHVNREIVDQVCAAALVLLTLIVAERPSKKLAALLGVVTGLAMLGNTRLDLPAGSLRRLPRLAPAARAADGLIAALVLGGAAVAVTPWIVRNKVQLGCLTITTDGRALWKANNLQTYGLLSSGQWIDNVSRRRRGRSRRTGTRRRRRGATTRRRAGPTSPTASIRTSASAMTLLRAPDVHVLAEPSRATRRS